jgi:NAD(P)-dependent dehydrogenase (short-subunit alcohol dehydrogenase family)
MTDRGTSAGAGELAPGSPRYDLRGHLAVVTGGSSGIGAATAVLLSNSGADVVIIGRDEQAANEVLRRCADQVRGEWLGCDVTDEGAVEATFAAIAERVGPPSILVNSAGLLVRASAEATSRAVWDEVFAVNLTGTFLCAREAAKVMRREGRGSIVNVSSEAGLRGIRGLAAYSAAKAAVVELTRCMALDLADAGVRVNCVCPGTTRTPMVLEAVERTDDPVAELARYANARPMKRLGTPEEIAAAIAYFASDDAAYATGAVLAVDGGFTA